MRSGALPAPTATNAIIGTTVAIICCCILLRTGDNRNNGSRNQQHGGSVPGSDVCEGLVDLIRDQDGNFAGDEEEEGGDPVMTREELARGRLVVVVFGPSSTAGYQSYVVNKLMRYLRWSNLARKHFAMSGQQSPPPRDTSPHNGTATSDYTGERGREQQQLHHQQHAAMVDVSSSDPLVSRPPSDTNGGKHEEGGARDAATNGGGGAKSDIASFSSGDGHLGGLNGDARHGANGDGAFVNGGSDAAKVGLGYLPEMREESAREEEEEDEEGGLSDRYTFSDRGKAAALMTIAVQESAKTVASWLAGLEGGVAVIDAGGTGWASTRQGREALARFLDVPTGPDVGLLWVEILPAGLSQQQRRFNADSVDDPVRQRGGEPRGPYQRTMPIDTPGPASSSSGQLDPHSGLFRNQHQPQRPPPPPQEQPRRQQGPAATSQSASRPSASPRWKSANGLPAMTNTPGSRVVQEFLRSGNLLGAGGRLLYESVRGGSGSSSREGARGTPAGSRVVGANGIVSGGRKGGRGGREGTKGTAGMCFVSLADQGLDVRCQLEHAGCPLVARVGTFAAALKMKKSWTGCPVYLTRHGESVMNQTGSMGGDTNLSEDGNRYASVLADFILAQADAEESRLAVWCSPMKRAVQTARAVKCRRYMEWQALRELDTGMFNGFSYKKVEQEYPEEFAARDADKLAYRYPQGESYLDVVNRLDPVVVALEKENGPIVIISHQAVLRCLYAYFLDIPLRQMPRMPIPLHTVVKLTPNDHIAQDLRAPRWTEKRCQLMRPTPLEKLAGAAARTSGYTETSQLGESLS